MTKYAIINVKTDPKLKKSAAKAAAELGVSLSAVLNNELRRLAAERRVTFRKSDKNEARRAAWSLNSDGSLEDSAEDIYTLGSGKPAKF